MQNPFESGHIKNYLLLYASIVVIMVLFFIASSLFHEIEEVEPKVFSTKSEDKDITKVIVEDKNTTNKFKLLDKAY